MGNIPKKYPHDIRCIWGVIIKGTIPIPSFSPSRNLAHDAFPWDEWYIYLQHEHPEKSTIHGSVNIQSSHGCYGLGCWHEDHYGTSVQQNLQAWKLPKSDLRAFWSSLQSTSPKTMSYMKTKNTRELYFHHFKRTIVDSTFERILCWMNKPVFHNIVPT